MCLKSSSENLLNPGERSLRKSQEFYPGYNACKSNSLPKLDVVVVLVVLAAALPRGEGFFLSLLKCVYVDSCP